MKTAMEQFDDAMAKLKAAQHAEAPLWEAVEAAGAGFLEQRTTEGMTLAERWFAARRYTDQCSIDAMEAAAEVARKVGLSVT